MADSFDLGLAFLTAHPAEAARVLESLSSRDAGALFCAIPTDVGARVLASMLPTAAARILTEAPESTAVAITAAAGTQSIVAILRHVSGEMRTRLLVGLPAAVAVTVRMLLGFPEDTVGAWTDTGIVALPASFSVSSALDQLRSAAATDLDQVFVIDPDQHLLGCIGLHTLVRADPRAQVGSLIKSVGTSLSAMMPMASARSPALWERTQALPVLDRDRRLIGVLRRAATTRAMRGRNRTESDKETAESLTGTVAGSYWRIVSGLSSAALSLLPQVKRVLPEDA